MVDHEAVLDFLMMGGAIRDAAASFGMTQADVKAIIREETERCADATEIRREWTLASRRLLQMELAFHRKALQDMDPTCAVIALKSNERRSALAGGGQAQPTHLIMSMTRAAIEEKQATTSTQRMLQALQALKASDPHRQEREEFNAMLAERDKAKQSDALPGPENSQDSDGTGQW